MREDAVGVRGVWGVYPSLGGRSYGGLSKFASGARRRDLVRGPMLRQCRTLARDGTSIGDGHLENEYWPLRDGTKSNFMLYNQVRAWILAPHIGPEFFIW